MIVTLKGEANNYWTTGSAGIYVLGPYLVNDRPHWLQDPGSKAIWYSEDAKTWAIGLQNDLGGFLFSINSLDEVAGPLEATTWKYYDGKKWVSTSDDIMVDTFTGNRSFIF